MALGVLNGLIADDEERISDYLSMLAGIYSYGYGVNGTPLTKELFTATYLHLADYHALRSELQDYINEKAVLEGYAADLLRAQEYYDKNQSYASEGGLYKKYADSYVDVNAAYGKDVTDPNVKVKYRFAGWYLDAEYAEPFDCAPNREMDFSWFASGDYFTSGRTQLNLYAKWADEEKGSEGLVFRAVYNQSGDQIGVAVVDYMNKAEYEASAIYGCEYNQFDIYEYSVNYNDSGVMPAELGANIELQIPASHGAWPVLGILRDAFLRHADDIVNIALPDSVAFFEEGAFHGCALRMISGSGNASYIAIDEQRVVYQIAVYQNAGSDVYVSHGTEQINVPANTLIAYASNVESTGSMDATQLTLRNGIVKIGDYAFYGASGLNYVEFDAALQAIGISAFEKSGLHGSVEGNGNKVVIGDNVESIGAYAFRDCNEINDFELTANSSLKQVGRDAFSTTRWYGRQKGLIAINNLLIGVRNAPQVDFDTDAGDLLITQINGVDKYSYTNAYGTIYYDVDGSRITDIVLNASITGITDYAFEVYTASAQDLKKVTEALATVTIAGTLEDGIAEGAFKQCVNLVKITAPNLSSTSTLSDKAFEGCSVPTIYVTDITALDTSWESTAYWTTENII